MNTNVPVQRDELGRLLPGRSLNPGGRQLNALTELREKFGKDLPKYFERLVKLSASKNETIALQALREILDRLIGKPIAVVESVHTRVDLGQLYLQALKQANEPRAIEGETNTAPLTQCLSENVAIK
jgi:hypothetical protein